MLCLSEWHLLMSVSECLPSIVAVDCVDISTCELIVYVKQQVNKLNALKLGVCSKVNACYIFVCIFFQICQKSNF